VATLADELKRVPLFSSLTQRQLKRLGRDFKERRFRPGTSIVRQGHMSGVDFFVIVEGEASVSIDGREVARLGPGDHFGELALIGERVRSATVRVRSATVTAEVPLRCLVTASWHFRRFVKDNPDVSWKLLQHLAGVVGQEQNKRTGSSAQSD
jgi:CRP/FNR family transcriptional regulator, cyclic AMP receptor protein